MSRSILGACLLAACCAATAAAADDPLAVQVNREVSISALGLNLNYREFQGAPSTTLNTENGWSAGFGISVSDVIPVQRDTGVFLRADYVFADGSTQHRDFPDGTPSAPSIAPLRINDLVAEAGGAASVGRNTLFLVFAQAEYREWDRHLPNGRFDKDEVYSFVAPGVGLRATWTPCPRLALSGKLGFEYMSWTQWKASGNAAIGVPPSNVSLGNRGVEQVGGSLDFALTKSIALKAQLTYSHFGFGRSQELDFEFNGVPGSHHEPDSTTGQTVAELGFAWMY